MAERQRRMMREFTIDEISGVDVPAQGPARVTLMKRGVTTEENLRMSKTFDSLDEATSAIAKAEALDRCRAMSEAARRFPALVQRYNADGEAMGKRAAEAAAPGLADPAWHAFSDRVDEIVRRDGLSRADAMTKARQRHPDAFAAAYGGAS